MVPTAPAARSLQPANRVWYAGLNESKAHRTRHLLLMSLVVCAVLPVGWWSRYDGASLASEPRPGDFHQRYNQSLQVDVEGNWTTQHNTVPPIVQEQPGNTANTSAATDTTAPVTAANVADNSSNPAAQGSAVAPASRMVAATVVTPPTGPTISFRVIVAGQVLPTTVTLPSGGADVATALKLADIEVGQYDRLFPAPTTPMRDGMAVRITRVRAELRKHQVAIEPIERFKPTPDIESGAKKTVQKGKAGVIEITERIWLLDGVETSREVYSRRQVEPARDTIIALGARARYMPGSIPYHNRYAQAYQLSGRGGSPRDRLMPPAPETFRALKSITLTATGYSPDPRENGGYTRTCTGLPIGYGAAAVDPRVVPLGSKLYVEGYGYAFACDIGGAIKGNRIDLAYDSYYVANTKGRRKMKVWILGK